MLKIPDIAAYLKIHKHSKKQSAEALLAQIGEFHLQAVPYNSPYNSQINTPLSWWKMCAPIPPYLQLLAIKLFSIIPHAASCERIWSICGWMVGKRRTRLSVDNLEAMSKIHSYYISNCKSELANYGKDRTAEEIRMTMDDTEEYETDDDYNEEEIEKIMAQSSTDDNIEQIQSQQLEILNVLDLDLMFKNNSVANRRLEVDDNFIQELNQEDDFDPDLLARNFINNTITN